MRDTFQLSKICQIAYLAAILIFTFLLTDRNLFGESKWIYFGSLAVFLVVPLIANIVIYKLTRNDVAGVVTFLLILGGLVAGQPKIVAEGGVLIGKLRGEEVKKDLLNTGALKAEMKKKQREMEELFQKIAGGNHPGAAQFSRDIEKLLEEEHALALKMGVTLNVVLKGEVLNGDLLNHPDDYTRRMEIINHYIIAVKEMQRFHRKGRALLRDRLKKAGLKPKAESRFIKEIQKYGPEYEVLEKRFLKLNLNFGYGMLGVLKLMQRHHGKWEIDRGAVSMKNGAVQREYERLVKGVIKTRIDLKRCGNQLSSKQQAQNQLDQQRRRLNEQLNGG